MNQPARTSTPEVDAIWSRRDTRDRWHQLWNAHLATQTRLNPRHPAHETDDLQRYRHAADLYAGGSDRYREDWDREADQEEQTTRHDLVAELNVYNRRAGATTAHLGLTSHDIVDTATQIAIADSMRQVCMQIRQVIAELAREASNHRETLILERTHGQPAQASLYGLRIATVLSPLLDWWDRATWHTERYRLRPPHGAVGTAADLTRVLVEGWGHNPAPGWDTVAIESYTRQIAGNHAMYATRQTYHRSYDLHTAGLLLELASIANTWATDRRLETILGLGQEQRDRGQIGSSAMPHKRNPVLCERITGLCNTIAGYHEMAARAASTEWLGGDVSGSSARRVWLPGIFQTTSAMLVNWLDAHHRWVPDTQAMAIELHRHQKQAITGSLLQQLIDRGQPRPEAHRMIADADSSGWVDLLSASDHWGLRPPALTVDGLGLRPARDIIDRVAQAASEAV